MFVDTSSFQIILSFHCPLRLRLLHLSAAGNCPQMSVSPDWSTYHLSLYWLELKVLPARRSSVSSPSVLFVPFPLLVSQVTISQSEVQWSWIGICDPPRNGTLRTKSLSDEEPQACLAANWASLQFLVYKVKSFWFPFDFELTMAV